MKPRPAALRRTALILVCSIASLLAAQPASALTYYWDSDVSTGGFGNTTGTWGTSAFWTTQATGGATHSGVSATLAGDIVNFGAPALNYANSTVGIAAGGVTANSIVFGVGQTTALTVGTAGGGSITLGSAGGSIIVNRTGHALNAPIILTGASMISFSREVIAAGGSFTLGGGMSGTGGVTFTTPNLDTGNQSQTINLGAASTYLGNTTITSGDTGTSTVIKNTSGAANALPVGTVLSLTGGNGEGASGRYVSFDLGGQNQTLAGLQNTVAASRRQIVTSVAPATLTINNNSPNNFTFGGGDSSISHGKITGAIALAKSGSGNFTLDATQGNTYTGGTTITGTGKLIAQGSSTALGNAASVVDVGSTATLQYNNNLGAGVSLAIENAITGAGTLEITGSNTVVQSDLNRTTTGVLSGFTGNISVLANGNYLIGGATKVTTNQNLTIAANGYLTMGESTGFGKLDGSGTIFRNSSLTPVTRTLALGNGDATGGNFSGNIRGESNESGSGLFGSGGIIAVTKVGTGTQTLSGSNTYAGATTISGGKLVLNNAAANNTTIATDANTATTSDILINGGTLEIAASEQIANTGSINMSSGAFNFGAAIGKTETIDKFTNSGGTFTTGANTLIGLGNTITWSGGTNTVSDGGSVQDPHIVISGGTNTVQGGATGGVLQLNAGGLGLEMSNGATLTLNSDNTVAGKLLLKGNVSSSGDSTVSIASGLALANKGNIDLDGGPRTFTVANGVAASDMTVSAVIANGALTKGGLGTLTLTGTNIYTGGTTITGGTLAVATGASLANTGAVTVGAGAILTGSGTIGGPTTIQANGTHNAGDSGVGTQAFGDALAYANSSIFDWDLNANSTLSGFDTVSAVGDITVGTNTIFNVIFGGSVNLTDPFWAVPHSTKTWSMTSIFGKLFTTGSFASVTSTANPVTQGSFTIDGTHLTWNAVPEPTTALAGLLLGAGLLRRRRAS